MLTGDNCRGVPVVDGPKQAHDFPDRKGSKKNISSDFVYLVTAQAGHL